MAAANAAEGGSVFTVCMPLVAARERIGAGPRG